MGQAQCKKIVENVDQMRLTAVVDAHEQTAREVGRLHGVPAFTTVAELAAAGVADMALIAVPHPLHPSLSEECLDAGLHVLCEKPLAETVSGADRMLEAARRCERTLGVMFQRRFDPVFEAALDFVRRGGVGEVMRTLLVLPDFRTQAYYEANPWRATWSGEGGGVLINQAPHMMDLFMLLGGRPASLRGWTTTTAMHDIEVEDRAEAVLRYSNGATGYFYASTTEPKHHEMLEIVGTCGSITYRNGNLECLSYDDSLGRICSGSDEVWKRPQVRHVTPDLESVPDNQLQACLMGNFARHILAGEPLRCDAVSARDSLEFANAVTLSSHLGQETSLPIPRAEYDELLTRLRTESPQRKKTQPTARTTDPGLV